MYLVDGLSDVSVAFHISIVSCEWLIEKGVQTAVAVSPSPDEGEGGKYQEYTFTFWTDFAQLHAAKTAHLDANPIEPASWSDAIPAEEPADEPVADADAGMDDS